MNIRVFVLALLSALFLTNTTPTIAMDEPLKKLADHAASAIGKELKEAGKEITKTLPTKIDVELSPRPFWGAILSVAGAMSIYQGLHQLWNTWEKSDQALQGEHVDRKKSYQIGLAKIAAGILSLGGSYAVWNWK